MRALLLQSSCQIKHLVFRAQDTYKSTMLDSNQIPEFLKHKLFIEFFRLHRYHSIPIYLLSIPSFYSISVTQILR